MVNKCLKNKITSIVLIIVIITFNTFAITISPSDGEAFITKAEFESLKNDFQNQLENYNSSIDSKIDTAIASYLAGIIITKKTILQSLIDSSGKYGRKIDLTWSSNTAAAQVSYSEKPYCLTNYSFANAEAVVTENIDPDTSKVTSLTYDELPNGVFEMPRIDRLGNQLSEEEAKNYGIWNVNKVVKVDIDGSEIKTIEFKKVRNIMNYNTIYWFANASNDGLDPIIYMSLYNIVDENSDKMTQQNLLDGVPLDYLRIHNATPIPDTGTYYYPNGVEVVKSAVVSIEQIESENNTHTYRPFSTQVESTWDPDDNTTLLRYDNSVRFANKYDPIKELYWINGGGPHRIFSAGTTFQSSAIKNHRFTWQRPGLDDGAGGQVKTKDFIVKNYYDIDKRNRAQKNGLVIGTTIATSIEQKLYLKCKADKSGTLYVYVGNTPIDNWTDASFTGKSFSLTAGEDFKLLEYGKAEKSSTIWVVFKPTSTSVDAKLMIDSMYVETE